MGVFRVLLVFTAFIVQSLITLNYANAVHQSANFIIEKKFGDVAISKSTYLRLLRITAGISKREIQMRPLSADASFPGLVVSKIKSNSFLKVANLRKGDVIERINLNSISSESDLFKAIKSPNNGRIIIVFWRNGLQTSIAIEIR